MKIKTWIKYYDKVKVNRHYEYIEQEEYVDFTIFETTLSALSIAFEDNSFEGQGKIYYDPTTRTLWRKAIIRDICVDEGEFDTPIAALSWWREHGSWFFPREWRDGEYPNKEKMMEAIQKEEQMYLLVDGELYIKTKTPFYHIAIFGLGNNRNNSGTGLFVSFADHPTIDNEISFNALSGEKAVETANRIAKERGDTNDIGSFKAYIKVYMPELIE